MTERPEDQPRELSALLGRAPTPTRRPTVPELEAVLFRPFDVLDHGFVRVIDYMGDDGAIVQAARVSYGAGTRAVRDDRGLIRYLVRNRHSSPLEMCRIKLHCKMPIFVARQWIRHRMASVNEVSARYSILDREFYLPEPAVLAEQSTSNRQGRGAPLSAEEATAVLDMLRADALRSYEHYEHLLNDDGTGEPVDPTRPQLARELARMDLSLNFYTQWYWTIDLHNLMHFLSLRLDSHAQYEIRAYAGPIADIVRMWVPLAFEAFEDYRLGAVTFSRQEIEIVRRLFWSGGAGDPLALDDELASSGLSVREQRELLAKIAKP